MTQPTVFNGLEESSLEHHEFELVDPEDADERLEAWFDGRRPDGMTFTVFAQDGTGGLYAVWQRGDQSIDHAPVVLLGSEGECMALAPDASSFLEAIASGWVVDAYDGSWFEEDDALDEDEIERRTQAQAWVRQRLGRETLRAPDTISALVKTETKEINAIIEALFV